MEGGLRFTLLTYSSEVILKESYSEALQCPPKYSVHCRIIDEADLKEHAHPDPQVYETKPYQEDGEIPMTAAYFFANGDLFMVGGMRSGKNTIDSNGETVNVFGDQNPSKGLWCAQPPPPVGYWIRRPTTMNSKRDFPIALPLRNDGRIFICGGTSEPKCWVEFYDPKKGMFEGMDLPAKFGSPYASSCFQYTDKEVMVMVYYPKKEMHSLLSYNLESNNWGTFYLLSTTLVLCMSMICPPKRKWGKWGLLVWIIGMMRECLELSMPATLMLKVLAGSSTYSCLMVTSLQVVFNMPRLKSSKARAGVTLLNFR